MGHKTRATNGCLCSYTAIIKFTFMCELILKEKERICRAALSCSIAHTFLLYLFFTQFALLLVTKFVKALSELVRGLLVKILLEIERVHKLSHIWIIIGCLSNDEYSWFFFIKRYDGGSPSQHLINYSIILFI